MNGTDKLAEGRIGWLRALYCMMRPQDRQNEIRVSKWSVIWVFTLILCGAPVQFGWVGAPWVWALYVLPLIPGVFVVCAFLKLLREADELLRQVQLEALATGFGAGFVTGLTVLYLAPPDKWWQVVPLLAMCLSYTARVTLAAREAAKEAEQ